MHMCPYARFQGVMFDKDTLAVAYDPRRGEARGPRKKGSDPGAQGWATASTAPCACRPHRHRYPRRLADGLHRLRGVHRRL
jgi:polyferredoxin